MSHSFPGPRFHGHGGRPAGRPPSRPSGNVRRWASSRGRAWAWALGLALVLLLPARTRAQSPADTALYVVSNTTTLSVVLNRTTGATASIATLAFATSALARDPVTKRIYYLSTNAATPLGRVAYYDPATGTNTILNALGNGDNVVRVTIGPDGTMWAIGLAANGSDLYSIDKATGAYTNYGSVRVGSAAGPLLPDNGDLAFHPTTGVLYASAASTDGSGTSLYTINLATRIATEIGTITNTSTHAALTFAAGVLYSGGGQGDLYRINNVATGTGTLVVDNNFPWFDFATGPPVADLQLTMTASTGMAAGGNATYTLTARNNGPYPATSAVTVVDTLPVGVTFTSATGTGWTCGASGQVVTCSRGAAAVASGTTLPAITLVAAITGAVSPSVTNVAHVASSTMDDQNLANNRAAVTSAVTVRSVAVTPDGATATRLPSNGTQYTQVFTVTNSGSLTDRYNIAASVTPAGVVTIVSTSIAQTANLAAGASASVTVTYTVANAAATGATATVRLTATSVNQATVSDAGTLVVSVARADLAIAKALYRDDRATLVTPSDRVVAGEYVQYRVTVTSSGGADAVTVAVTDALPAQVAFDAASGDAAGWTFTATPAAAPTSLAASLAGTLAAGQSRFFWIRVRVK